MKANREKVMIAMARARINASDLAASCSVARSSINNAIAGRSVRPATMGRIAYALGVDVTEIMEGAAL